MFAPVPVVAQPTESVATGALTAVCTASLVTSSVAASWTLLLSAVLAAAHFVDALPDAPFVAA